MFFDRGLKMYDIRVWQLTMYEKVLRVVARRVTSVEFQSDHDTYLIYEI